jgi:hypothetical protein
MLFKNATVTRLLQALLVTCLFLAPRQAAAYLVSGLSATRLTEKSDVIVRGRVAEVTRPNTKRLLARIEVDAVLKGDWNGASLSIDFGAPSPFGGVDSVVKNEYALFFLLRKGAQVVPCDEQNIEIAIRQGRPVLDVEPVEPLDLVREELLFTASQPSRVAEREPWLQRVLDRSRERAPDANPERSIQALFVNTSLFNNTVAAWQLGFLPPHPGTVDLLTSLLRSEDYFVRQAAITSLLNLGQLSALGVAVAFIESEPPPVVPRLIAPSYSGDDAMFAALASFNRRKPEALEDPAIVAAFGAMLKRPSVELRRAAADVLAQMYHGHARADSPRKSLYEKRSVPFLAEALDDEDVSVRYRAMSGLAWATGNYTRGPHYDRPKNDYLAPRPTGAEQKLVTYWKNWWSFYKSGFAVAPATLP